MQNSRFDFAAVDCCHATYFSQRVCAARCCLPTAWCVHDWGTSVSTRAAHRRVVRVCSRGATSGRGKCVDPHWVRGGPCPGQHAVHGNMRLQIPVSPERRKVARHSLRKAACALYWCEPTFSVGNESSATRTRKNSPSRFGSRIGLACLCRRAFFGDGPKLSAFLNDVILQALLSNWR